MGLPRSLGLPGAAILFMKGKREAAGELPRFKYPEVLHYEGAPIFIGREDGAFAVVSIGDTPVTLLSTPGLGFRVYNLGFRV